MGKMKVQIVSLKAGSVIVRLKILIEDPEFPRDLSVFDSMISNLHKSAVFQVDLQSSGVKGRLFKNAKFAFVVQVQYKRQLC